jgi:hypothetical protein
VSEAQPTHAHSVAEQNVLYAAVSLQEIQIAAKASVGLLAVVCSMSTADTLPKNITQKYPKSKQHTSSSNNIDDNHDSSNTTNRNNNNSNISNSSRHAAATAARKPTTKPHPNDNKRRRQRQRRPDAGNTTNQSSQPRVDDSVGKQQGTANKQAKHGRKNEQRHRANKSHKRFSRQPDPEQT